MGHISDIQFFRDLNKNPEWEPEISRAEIAEEKEKDAKNDKNKGKRKKDEPEKKPENFTNEIVANYQTAINLVNDFSLKEEFKGDESGERLIENRKEAVLKLLRKILDDVEKYIAQINALRLSRSNEYADTESYQVAVGDSDAVRRSLHNKLIGDIKLAMRVANVSFNSDFPEENRIEEEKKFSDSRGLSDAQVKAALAKRNFVRFPYGQGIFIDWAQCPKNQDGEREFIMHWAAAFYKDLTKLKEDLDQELKITSRN
jgi:NADH dehydrogenase/NADH:ubiquinone oxidoreductase subunit G